MTGVNFLKKAGLRFRENTLSVVLPDIHHGNAYKDGKLCGSRLCKIDGVLSRSEACNTRI